MHWVRIKRGKKRVPRLINNALIPNVAEKNILILVEGKKII
jgi:hypothetical protein